MYRSNFDVGIQLDKILDVLHKILYNKVKTLCKVNRCYDGSLSVEHDLWKEEDGIVMYISTLKHCFQLVFHQSVIHLKIKR